MGALSSSSNRAGRCPQCLSTDVTEYTTDGRALCKRCHRRFTVWQELRDVFHQAWGQATKSPEYKKVIWGRIVVIVEQMFGFRL